jgi:hypothetical protein
MHHHLAAVQRGKRPGAHTLEHRNSRSPERGREEHPRPCRSYTHFCACGRAVDARLEELGGSRFALRVDINREDWKAVDTWIGSVVAGLAELPLKTVGRLPGRRKSSAADFQGETDARGGRTFGIGARAKP